MHQGIDGATKLLGLLGHKIAYSLSPAIHNFSIKQLGLNQVYVPLDCPESSLPALVKCLWDLGCPGFNVTQPHKKVVAALLEQSDGSSINTVYRGAKGFLGTSTDGIGFVEAVARIGVSVKNLQKVVILGSGGAASAITAYLGKIGFSGEIVSLSRGPGAAQGNTRPFTVDTLRGCLKASGDETILVQATSAPHKGEDLGFLVRALDDFGGAVIDICYGKVSRLLDAAQTRKLRYQDGLPMLIEQARASQHIWWGKSAAHEAIARELAANSNK